MHSAPANDEMRITLAGHLRLSSEFEIADPFSMRVDLFTLVRLWERTFGNELARLAHPDRFMSGLALMGVWSFE